MATFFFFFLLGSIGLDWDTRIKIWHDVSSDGNICKDELTIVINSPFHDL